MKLLLMDSKRQLEMAQPRAEIQSLIKTNIRLRETAKKNLDEVQYSMTYLANQQNKFRMLYGRIAGPIM
jgi:hypothetical protein